MHSDSVSAQDIRAGGKKKVSVPWGKVIEVARNIVEEFRRIELLRAAIQWERKHRRSIGAGFELISSYPIVEDDSL